MPVATEISQVEYTGNGVTDSFPTTFKFFSDSDVVVKLKSPGGEYGAPLADGVDYQMSGAGSEAGGNVMFPDPVANGDTIQISRTLPLTQTTEFSNQGSFSPALHTALFDRLTMVAQQIKRDVTASIVGLAGTAGAPFAFLTPAATDPNALQVRFRSDGVKGQVSEHGGIWKRLVSSLQRFSVSDLGAVGDFATDDSSAIQAAFNKAVGGGKVFTTYFPQDDAQGSDYRITDTVSYDGDTSGACRIQGEIASRGATGVRVIWDGPAPMVCAAGSLVRTGTTVRATFAGAQPWVTGQKIINTLTEGTLYAGRKIITAHGSTWFEYTETGPNGETSAVAHTFGQSMFELRGFNSSFIEHIQINGGDKALYGIWVQRSSASVYLEHAVISGMAIGGESVHLAIGEAPDVGGTYQTSEVWTSHCEMGSVGAGYGIRVLAGGNTKNMDFGDTIINFCRVAIAHPGEGVITAHRSKAINSTRAVFELGPSRASIIGFEAESSHFEAYANAKLFAINSIMKNSGKGYLCREGGLTAGAGAGPTGTGTGIIDGACVFDYIGLDGCRFLTGGASSSHITTTIQDSSWSGEAPSVDDVVIDVNGILDLAKVELSNSRTPGVTLPWVRISGCTRIPNVSGVGGGANVSSLRSFGCDYINAIGVAPFIDGSGNLLQASTAANAGYARIVPHSISSIGDRGGVIGGLNPLREFKGHPPSYASLVCQADAVTGVTDWEMGEDGTNQMRRVIAKEAWTAAATSQVLPIFLPNARWKIQALTLLVSPMFAGRNGTITLKAGSTSGGDEYLLAKDVKTSFSLAFDNQTGNFTVGQVVTGGTSGATGTITGMTDAGSSGTLILSGVLGVFADNEALTDPLGGAADANGTQAVAATRTELGRNAPAELGVNLTTYYSPNGFIPSITTYSTIYLTLTSGTGNLGTGSATVLTHGEVEVILEALRLPGAYS